MKIHKYQTMDQKVEPMVNMGRKEVKVLSDNWTAVTRDKSLSAHFEHSILITEDECIILTTV
jgi:methionyl aminopeptidase